YMQTKAGIRKREFDHIFTSCLPVYIDFALYFAWVGGSSLLLLLRIGYRSQASKLSSNRISALTNHGYFIAPYILKATSKLQPQNSIEYSRAWVVAVLERIEHSVRLKNPKFEVPQGRHSNESSKLQIRNVSQNAHVWQGALSSEYLVMKVRD